MTEHPDAADAFKIGWYVAALLKMGLSVTPVVINGMYTNAVDWRVQSPDGRFVTVRLVIDPNVEQP